MSIIEVIHSRFGNKWEVVHNDFPFPLDSFPTQAQAVAYGRQRARQDGAELIIKDSNDRIQSRDTYGNDPLPPRG